MNKRKINQHFSAFELKDGCGTLRGGAADNRTWTDCIKWVVDSEGKGTYVITKTEDPPVTTTTPAPTTTV